MTLAWRAAWRSPAGSASSRACSRPTSVPGRRSVVQPVGVHRPVRLADDDDAVVDEPAHQLFHVVRVALGAADDELGQLGRHRVQALQQRLRQRVAVRSSQRGQRHQRLGRAPVGPARQQRRPAGHHQRQRQLGRVRQQVLQQVQRAVVGPVQVFDDQHRQRAALVGQRLQVAAQGGEGLVAQAARVQAAHVRAVAEVQARTAGRSAGPGARRVRRTTGSALRPPCAVPQSALSVSATPHCTASRLRSRPQGRSRPSGCERTARTRQGAGPVDSAALSSRSSRLLPRPASPTSVSACSCRVWRARATVSSRRCNSASRPTIGVVSPCSPRSTLARRRSSAARTR